MKASCIQHAAQSTLVIVREDYLSICDGDHCAAALLNDIEYWTNIKLSHFDQAAKINTVAEEAGELPEQDMTAWIWKTQVDFVEELLNLFGERRVRTSLQKLLKWGYIVSRRNPVHSWDATLQYMLCISVVQQAVNSTVCRVQNLPSQDGTIYRLESAENAVAIPKTTTKTTKRVKDSAPKAGAESTPKPRERDEIFDLVAIHIFGIDDPSADGGRIAKISNWLKGKYAGPRGGKVGYISSPAEPRYVASFALYCKQKGFTPPLDFVKFVEHWRAWASSLKANGATPENRVLTLAEYDRMLQEEDAQNAE